ncbi:MAG: hypothetical protein ACOCRO_06700 [Halanaerobiales bacterium]
MSIKDIQTSKAMNKIIIDQLKGNVNPSGKTLTHLMYKYFNENSPGIPTFKGLSVGKRSTTDIESYWKSLDDIEWDLDVLYKSILSQNQKIINSFKEEEMERKEIVNRLKNLSYKADETLKISKNTNSYYLVDDFNFTNFNNYQNDITSLIDLNYNYLTLNPQLKKSAQFSIDNIEIENIKNESKLNITAVSDIKNCINDYENKSWIHRIVVPKNNLEEIKSTSITLLVELNKKSIINQMEINSNTKDNTHIELELSKDKSNWTTIDNASGIDNLKEKLTIYFKPIETKYARIKLKKVFNENDSTINGNFLYSLNNISFYRTFYEKNGQVKTNKKSIEPGNVIDKITIDAKEYIPKGTDIKYFIDIYKDDEVEEYEVVPKNRSVNNQGNTEINLKNTDNKLEILPELKEKKRFEIMDSYNIRFYELNKNLSENIIPKETKVYKGINQWEKSVYQYYRGNTYRISLNDWIQKPVRESKVIRNYHSNIENKNSVIQDIEIADHNTYPCKFKYIENENVIDVYKYSNNTKEDISSFNVDQYGAGDSEYVVSDVNADEDEAVYMEYPAFFLNYKFTTWVYLKEQQSFETYDINLDSKYYNDSFEYDAFYINSNKSKKIVNDNTHKFKGNLKKGWNRIDYICYVHDPTEDSGFLNNSIVSIINESESNTSVQDKENHSIVVTAQRADKESMKYKSVYELENNILKNEHKYFTVYPLTDGYVPVVNNRDLANYAVKYKTVINNYTDYELKVVQESEDENFTPILENVFVNFIYN